MPATEKDYGEARSPQCSQEHLYDKGQTLEHRITVTSDQRETLMQTFPENGPKQDITAFQQNIEFVNLSNFCFYLTIGIFETSYTLPVDIQCSVKVALGVPPHFFFI